MFKIKYFTFGAIGSLISAISIGIMLVIDSLPVFLDWYSYIIFRRIFLFLTILLGVGVLLASFGYREMENKYGLLSGTAGFAFGIFASVLLFSTAIIGLITPDYVISIYPPPLIHQINWWISFLNGVFFGLTIIVWGTAHFKSRKFCRKPRLSLAVGGFFIASGVVILSIFYSNFGLGLSIVGLLFASIVFLNLGCDINHKSLLG